MMDLVPLLLNAYNLVVALFVLVDALIDFFRFWGFAEVIIDLFCITTAIVIAILEIFGSQKLVEFLPIMKQWIGRGILYILLGILCLGHWIDENNMEYSLAAGIIVMILGAAAIGLHFLQVPISLPLLVNLKGESNAAHLSSDNTSASEISYQRVESNPPPMQSSYQTTTNSNGYQEL